MSRGEHPSGTCQHRGALARAYLFLGDDAKALDHVRRAIGTYADADELKVDAALAPIRKEIKALFTRRDRR